MIATIKQVVTQSAAQPAAPVVKLRHAGKRYGERWAIRDVDLTLYPGDILGFIGPNGAGKTTLMKLMAGLSRATEGEITVLSQRLDAHTPRTPDGVGLVLEQIGFIPYLSGRKNLEALARIRNVATPATIRETLATVGLDPDDKRPVRAYSLGMRQRLALGQALMEQPRLLLLDEPTNGLDPAGIVALRTVMRQFADTGVAIFLASHLLTEVERVCDRVLLVREGAVVREIVPEQERALTYLRVTSEADATFVMQWANHAGIVAERLATDGGWPAFHLITTQPVPGIVRELVHADVNIESIGVVRQSLEEAFMELVGSAGP